MTHPENWTNKSSEERGAEIVRRLLVAEQSEKALEIARERGELVWVADDGNAEVEYDYVDTRREAAEEYVSDGDWGECESTHWVTVYTWPRYRVDDVEVDDLDDRESHTVAIEPEEPSCSESEHDWQSPHDLVGGCEQNPGVYGHGGGVYINEVCMHCGCGRTTDTWAQNRENGEQGLTSVSYEPGKYAGEIPSRREERLARKSLGCHDAALAAAVVIAAYGGEHHDRESDAPARAREVAKFIRAARTRGRYVPTDDRAARLALHWAISDARTDGGRTADVAEYVARRTGVNVSNAETRAA